MGSSVVTDVHFRAFEGMRLINYRRCLIFNTCSSCIPSRSIIPENILVVPFLVNEIMSENPPSRTYSEKVIFLVYLYSYQNFSEVFRSAMKILIVLFERGINLKKNNKENFQKLHLIGENLPIFTVTDVHFCVADVPF